MTITAPQQHPRPVRSIARALLVAITAFSVSSIAAQSPATKSATPPAKTTKPQQRPGQISEQQRQVDSAIVKGLEFLAREQQPSGAWTVGRLGESTATTSLAVMAFMAAGHVPGEGPYGRQLQRGIRWVVDHQRPDDMLVHRRSHGPMYSHGISSLMLAEVIGMVDQPLANDCRQALKRAIALILKSQNVAKANHHAGGWRYQPTSTDSDISVSGWQLLALRAARNVGADVPAENIDRAVEYIRRCSVQNQRGFAYQPGGAPTPTRAGTGILALEICGKHRSDETLGAAEYLLARPLKYTDHYFFYGVYYCSVGMFKVGGDYWTETRNHLVPILLAEQETTGSWQAKHGSERTHGANYATCMSVLALAVEYQYPPIYQR